jgi:E3 ubiquitin-protein ligase BRE1
VDTADLQHENHRLAQQLDAQRTEIHDLETKLQELKRKQMSYDESLASIQDSWEEVSPL